MARVSAGWVASVCRQADTGRAAGPAACSPSLDPVLDLVRGLARDPAAAAGRAGVAGPAAAAAER